MCLKLLCRDDFVVLHWNRNVVFVPRYARKLFIDHWILLVQIFCKPGFAKPGFHTAFRALVFLSSRSFKIASRACGKWQETCYSVAPRACGKWQETCYSVAPRACGKWQETCYSVASRGCGKWEETCYSVASRDVLQCSIQRYGAVAPLAPTPPVPQEIRLSFARSF